MKKIILLFLLLFPLSSFAETAPVDPYDDLALTEVIIEPSSVLAINQESKITFKVKNNGSRLINTEQGTNLYKYQLDNFKLSDYHTPTISYSKPVKAGEFFYYVFEGRFLTSGTKTVSLEINTGKDLEESDYKNNYISKQIRVVPLEKTDIAVDTIKLEKDKPLLDQDQVINVYIKNTGETSLTSAEGFYPEDIVYSFFDFEISSSTHDDLPSFAKPFLPGAKFKYTYRGKFNKAGPNKLSFSIDRRNFLTYESDKKNNSSSTAIEIFHNQAILDDFDIENLEYEFINATSTRIKWHTAQKTIGAAACWPNRKVTSFEYAEKEKTETNDHSLILGGLSTKITFYCSAQSSNSSVTRTKEFTIDGPVNNSIYFSKTPVLSISSSEKKIIAAWSTNFLSSGTIKLKNSAGDITSSSSPASSVNHLITISNLAPGKYSYWVISTSTSGQEAKTSEQSFEITDTEMEKAVNGEKVVNDELFKAYKGRIYKDKSNSNKLYYIDLNKNKFSLDNATKTEGFIKSNSLKTKGADISGIAISTANLSGKDSDGDGLPDAFEEIIGTNKNKSDSDGDGYNDKIELEKGYSPLKKGGKKLTDSKLYEKYKGKILLGDKNEAWYVDGKDGKKYFLGKKGEYYNGLKSIQNNLSGNEYNKL